MENTKVTRKYRKKQCRQLYLTFVFREEQGKNGVLFLLRFRFRFATSVITDDAVFPLYTFLNFVAILAIRLTNMELCPATAHTRHLDFDHVVSHETSPEGVSNAS